MENALRFAGMKLRAKGGLGFIDERFKFEGGSFVFQRFGFGAIRV